MTPAPPALGPLSPTGMSLVDPFTPGRPPLSPIDDHDAVKAAQRELAMSASPIAKALSPIRETPPRACPRKRSLSSGSSSSSSSSSNNSPQQRRPRRSPADLVPSASSSSDSDSGTDDSSEDSEDEDEARKKAKNQFHKGPSTPPELEEPAKEESTTTTTTTVQQQQQEAESKRWNLSAYFSSARVGDQGEAKPQVGPLILLVGGCLSSMSCNVLLMVGDVGRSGVERCGPSGEREVEEGQVAGRGQVFQRPERQRGPLG